MMLKRMIKKIISLVVVIVALVNVINLWVDHSQEVEEYEAFYAKQHLTAQDIKTESTYKTNTVITPGEEGTKPPSEVKYKKLYGIEYIGEYEVKEEGGIEVKVLHGDNVKVLILDEEGEERFYRELSTLTFEPGEAGGYDVYLVGNKFTGRVSFSTY